LLILLLDKDIDSIQRKLDCTGLVSTSLPPLSEPPIYNDALMEDEFFNSADMGLPADFSWVRAFPLLYWLAFMG